MPTYNFGDAEIKVELIKRSRFTIPSAHFYECTWSQAYPKGLAMDNAELERNLLIEEARGYIEILSQRGLGVTTPDLEAISLPDLRAFVRRVRDLARTPSAG